MARTTSRVSMVLVRGPLCPFADAYREMLKERGYSRLSAVNLQRQVAHLSRCYVEGARKFALGLACELSEVTPAEVTAAVLAESTAAAVSTTQNYVASLRAFLRFCFLEGLIDRDLSEAALPMTGRRRSSLPRGIAKQDADALLASCDRRSAIGRRDYALIITLLRLGLRRGEVASMRLDDIDWRAGELVVVGKGGRSDRLPLPTDVGEAIAAYLRRGRPASDRREVFLRARAPFAPMASGTVASTVRRACRRAGVAEVGAHRLRHTAACEMVAAEVPLPQIAQVLRHRSLQSTAIYDNPRKLHRTRAKAQVGWSRPFWSSDGDLLVHRP